MPQLTFGKISLADLKQFITIEECGIQHYSWTQVDAVQITEQERQQIQFIQSRLVSSRAHLFNEATIWGRAIYPLLILAEKPPIQALSEVLLAASYPTFTIEGIADGVLAKCIATYVETPYLVVVEAKRGLEAQNPQFQLYGQLLAAARMNWEANQQEPQEIFGCYTIADSWAFCRAEVSGMDSDKPTLYLESSREYSGAVEAETVFKILKRIVAAHY